MAVDAFLKVDGIDGESTDDQHSKWIEVQSFSFGLTQPASAASGSSGRTAERVNISDFSVVKQIDSSSPTMALACCDGRHIKEVKVEICEASGDKHVYATYTMEDVIVSGYQPSGAKGGEKVTESVSFNFGKIKWEYTPIGQDGKPGSKVGPMGWNLETNKKI